MLLERHLFVPDWAHVVIVAMIDVSLIRVHYTDFKRLPSCLWSMLECNILGAARFVEIPGRTFHPKVLAELIEPAKDLGVARERTETNLFEGLREAKDIERLLLCQERFAPGITLLTHVAE